MTLERAGFSPARNEQGTAVADSFAGRVHWQLPSVVPNLLGYEIPLRPADGFPVELKPKLFAELAQMRKTTAAVRLDIDESGKLAGCHLLEPTGVEKVDALVCKKIKRLGSFKPGHTRDGRPTRASIVKQVLFHGRGAAVSLTSEPDILPD